MHSISMSGLEEIDDKGEVISFEVGDGILY
jgi:hypothetical protein